MSETATIPHQSYAALFARFLRFGLLAWGGPVAQIAMVRQELVEEGRWITRERFNRVLAVYQVLPGPEAHELCVYFGYLARGRLGGLLAGLGFMLPGFVLMLALSWVYLAVGLTPLALAIFLGIQPAVVALIVRAIERIGRHALTDRWLWGIALCTVVVQVLGAAPLVVLLGAGLAYAVSRHPLLSPILRGRPQGGLRSALAGGLVLVVIYALALALPQWAGSAAQAGSAPQTAPTVFTLLLTGLRAGLLTFGGAYTAIPFVRNDAVVVGGWMSDAQFLDGLALSGILPAPLIIFATFVGYLGGGLAGACALTVGVFAPAFAFTLIGHEWVERMVTHTGLHAFLDGVTAGVVGVIVATAWSFAPTIWRDVPSALIFGVALVVLYRWRAPAAVAVVIVGAGLVGVALSLVGWR